MRILGTDVTRDPAASAAAHTVVLLDDGGRITKVQRASTTGELAAAVGVLAAGEPFLLGVNVPLGPGGGPARTARPVDRLVRRRLGYRLPFDARAARPEAQGLAGETLLAGLAAAGLPCLTYPDRSRHEPALAEIHAGLTLKALAWQASPLAAVPDPAARHELFRAYAVPAYRTHALGPRAAWAERASGLDVALRLASPAEGFDLEPARAELARAGAASDVERAAGLFDAALIAGTARRYLEAPETCVFIGDREDGYVILPADEFLRRLALSDARKPRGQLFPQTSLRQHLGAHAELRPVDLLGLPGRPHRVEVRFHKPPRYEFDNLDEMLWWKHCRHVSGPGLPTDGLCELAVALDGGSEAPGADAGSPLRLVRSRHRTLSFRFEPPGDWRARVPTRDGRTYPLHVLRAVYETVPGLE